MNRANFEADPTDTFWTYLLHKLGEINKHVKSKVAAYKHWLLYHCRLTSKIISFTIKIILLKKVSENFRSHIFYQWVLFNFLLFWDFAILFFVILVFTPRWTSNFWQSSFFLPPHSTLWNSWKTNANRVWFSKKFLMPELRMTISSWFIMLTFNRTSILKIRFLNVITNLGDIVIFRSSTVT